MSSAKLYPVEEAIKAQKSLRAAAGLGPEQFPIQAFVGMISDEIESLREDYRSGGRKRRQLLPQQPEPTLPPMVLQQQPVMRHWVLISQQLTSQHQLI